MAASSKILVTSALPSANSSLHLGHIAGAYLPADIYVRYQRLKGTDVLFICGTDEHGVPITIRAEQEGVTPREVLDRFHAEMKRDFVNLGISFDNFSRTSLPLHHKVSQEFFTRLMEKGYLEPKENEKFYCPNCKRFLADRYIEGACPHCQAPGARGDQCEACGKWLELIQLVNPVCKVCGSTPKVRRTKHWFFKLSMFQKPLEDWITTKGHWKDNVKRFCKDWFAEGLQDRAITRDMAWGIPVPLPEAEGKVLYVWFEAPIGYISSTMEWSEKIGKPDKWKEYWLDKDTQLVHFMGKDNIMFHAMVWPAELMGHGDFVLPAEIPANEFLNLKGLKFSKSRNIAVWLKDALAAFPPDPLRYYLAANAPESRDAEFDWKEFQAHNNSELADNLGNFINRTLIFIERYNQGAVPQPGKLHLSEEDLLKLIENAPVRLGNLFETFQVRRACEELLKLSAEGNKYFNDAESWRTRTQDPERYATTLFICTQLVKCLTVLMAPVLPFSSEKTMRMLALDTSKISWEDAGKLDLAPGHKLGRAEILFPKIEDALIDNEIANLDFDSSSTIAQEPSLPSFLTTSPPGWTCASQRSFRRGRAQGPTSC
jgi:methionyl-tRNA synthetase